MVPMCAVHPSPATGISQRARLIGLQDAVRRSSTHVSGHRQKSRSPRASMGVTVVCRMLMFGFVALIFSGCTSPLADRATSADEDLVNGPPREAIWSIFPPGARTKDEVRTPGTTNGFYHHSDPGTITATVEVSAPADVTRSEIVDRAEANGWSALSVRCGPAPSEFAMTLTLATSTHTVVLRLRGTAAADVVWLDVQAELRHFKPEWGEPRVPDVSIARYGHHCPQR